ncbi:GGDEF domain-containing protein [Oceanimonas doudoroffii]|uniref:diguanylate cyclase n=2 Tax=Aeromonadaceae TaxID=84642 RepID=A0A233RK91_9GAMM|nr:GGDEF domain-containing protein [Oceanimonas doudoroffii]
MLQELTAVIAGLGNMVEALEALPEQTDSDQDGRGLLVQWHKLFQGQGSQEQGGPRPPELTQLLAGLQQHLARLRRYHQQSGRLQQVLNEQMLQAAQCLSRLPQVPARLQSLLPELETPDAGGLHHLGPLFECYQQSLELAMREARQQRQFRADLCQRLLQLIDELDYNGTSGEEISSIQQRLLRQPENTVLADLCLRLIELVIEGCRSERQHSTRFLARLNDSLEDMQSHFSASVIEGRNLASDRARDDRSLAGELKAMGESLGRADNSRLREEIAERVHSITQLLSHHEQLQEREQALLQRLNEVETRLHSMQHEAAEYRHRLTSQNQKLLIDHLTQIYNRTALNERLESEYRRWLRHGDPLAIVLLDIDHFKDINDNFGHLAGDKALRVIARTIRENLRETDFVARFGGEEFVVLMLNVDPGLVSRPLEQLRKKIESIPFRFKDERVTITISIGATLLQAGDSTTSAMERADQALYQAKHAGRNRLIID